MENAMVRFEPPAQALTLGQMCEYADVFVQSGIFKDATSQAQAVVKIMAGQELGLEPFAAMSELHIIDGKVTQSAGLLAKKIKQSGVYDYKIEEHTAEICTVSIWRERDDARLGTETLTMSDAIKRGLTTEWSKARNQVVDKANWKKHPKNMLFARVISNAVRFYCPDVTGEIVAYTHGEIDEPIDAEFTSEPTTEPERRPKKAKGAPAPTDNASITGAAPGPLLPTIESEDTAARSTRIAQELSAEFRAELKRKENEELGLPKETDTPHPKHIFWEDCKRLMVKAVDAKTIWDHFNEVLPDAQDFLTFFPRKQPIIVSLQESLEIWTAEQGHLTSAVRTAKALGEDKARRIAGNPANDAPPAEFYDETEPPTPEAAAFEAQAPTGVTRSRRSLKDDPVGLDATPFWKWTKTEGLDSTLTNRKRINQIIELNSTDQPKRGRDGISAGETEIRTNWQAVVHQVKIEFSA